MIGEHALRLTEANTGSYVPLCSCGWIGLMHGTPVARGPRGGITERHSAIAEQEAQVEHAKHVERCARPRVDRMHP